MRSQQQKIPVNVYPGMYLIYLDLDLLVIQSCLTLCDPVDSSPPGSSVRRISQARMLEWVVISSSRDLPHLRIESMSLAWVLSLPLCHLPNISIEFLILKLNITSVLQNTCGIILFYFV